MKMKSNYKEQEKKKSLLLIQENKIFNGDKGGKRCLEYVENQSTLTFEECNAAVSEWHRKEDEKRKREEPNFDEEIRKSEDEFFNDMTKLGFSKEDLQEIMQKNKDILMQKI